jgi:hypothetical protein
LDIFFYYYFDFFLLVWSLIISTFPFEIHTALSHTYTGGNILTGRRRRAVCMLMMGLAHN